MRRDLPAEGRSAWIAKEVTRISERSVNPRVKNYHWGDFTAGLFEAKDNGFETVILLDEDGHVTEGPGFNVFAIKDDRLVTSDHGSWRVSADAPSLKWPASWACPAMSDPCHLPNLWNLTRCSCPVQGAVFWG